MSIEDEAREELHKMYNLGRAHVIAELRDRAAQWREDEDPAWEMLAGVWASLDLAENARLAPKGVKI